MGSAFCSIRSRVMSVDCFLLGMRIFWFLTVWMISLENCRAEAVVAVTHADIRDVMLMMVRVMAATESKLQRHEMRERVFSEHLSKSLLNLDKRLSKLDEKISRVLSAEHASRNSVIDINNSLTKIPVVINDLKTDIVNEIKSKSKIQPNDPWGLVPQGNSTTAKPKPVAQEESSEEDKSSSTENIQILTGQMELLQKDLSEMKGVQIKSYELIEEVQINLRNKDILLQEMQNKLDGHNNLEVPAQDAPILSEWQINLIEALERQEHVVEKTLAQVKNMRNESLNELRLLEESIKDITSDSKIFLEDAVKDFVKMQDSKAAEYINLTSKIDFLNLAVEDIRRNVSEIAKRNQKEDLESYCNSTNRHLEMISKNDDATIILEALEMQNQTIFENLLDIKSVLADSIGMFSEGNATDTTQDQILQFLGNLDQNLKKNADSSTKLLERMETIVSNENQMLEFSKNSSQGIIETVETLMINMDVYFALGRQENVVEKTLAQVKNMRNERLNELRLLEESIKDITSDSKKFLEDAVKDFVKMQDSKAVEYANLTSKIDILNLAVEDIRRNVSEITKRDQKGDFESYFNSTNRHLEMICKNDDATIILEALEMQNETIFENLLDIKSTLADSIAMSSWRNTADTTQDQILQYLDNLDQNLKKNADSSTKLLDGMENIVSNESQMLEFSKNSSQDIIEKVEMLMLNMDVYCRKSG